MGDVQEAFYSLAPHLLDTSVDTDGTIHFADRLFVYFHTEMFATLFDNMEDVAGPVIRRKIKAFGEDAGQQIAAKMDAEFEDTSIKEVAGLLNDSGFDLAAIKQLGKTDDHAQIEKIFGYGRHVGWVGQSTIETHEDGTMMIHAENTFESASNGETGKKECRFLTGVIQGMMQHFWDRDNITADEKQCACQGHDRCTFEVTADGS